CYRRVRGGSRPRPPAPGRDAPMPAGIGRMCARALSAASETSYCRLSGSRSGRSGRVLDAAPTRGTH
ncbi:MAG: hypothetical protein AVDCRST_MAG41-4412, partial [uncultured Corynebacteriales bacterium]